MSDVERELERERLGEREVQRESEIEWDVKWTALVSPSPAPSIKLMMSNCNKPLRETSARYLAVMTVGRR